MSTRQATIYSEALPGTGSGPQCQLVVIEGPDQGRAIRLGSGDLIVGTGSECDLRLTDMRVSSRHMSVRLASAARDATTDGDTARDGDASGARHAKGDRFVVCDLGSKNGVAYEGSLVSEATVPVGATLKLGRSFVRIQPVAMPVPVEPSQSRRFGELVAESLAMREVFAVLELAAASDTTILLEGETGTGKELAARAIHEASARRKGPFVAVDCGALPETLLESELFGHVRGAFTGATGQRGGAFLRAHGGTIFLDELAGVSATVQARLLRVIEERAVKPVGADDARKVDLRIVAASRDDLEVRVAEGQFRADLYYRLSVIRVSLPPLRSRREDIGAIASELMRRRGVEPGVVAGDNLDALMSHHWPGNVRELRNIIDRAIALSPGAREFGDLRLSLGVDSERAGSPGGGDMLPVRTDLSYADAKQAVLHVFERRYLGDVLARCRGNISEAARQTGLDRKHLRTLLRKHDLIPPRDD